MFSPNHSARDTSCSQFEQVVVKEERECSISPNHPTLESGSIGNVIMEGKEELKVPSNHFNMEFDILKLMAVKIEEHEGYKTSNNPEPSQRNEDHPSEEDIKVHGGNSDDGASGSNSSMWKHPTVPSSDSSFVLTTLEETSRETSPNHLLNDFKPYEPECTLIEDDDFLMQLSKEINCTDKKYTCSHCEYKADNKDRINKHLLTHSSNEDKLFACNHCHYTTNFKHHLKKHNLTHVCNREKPFSCDHCKYRSDCKGSLKRHLLAQHGNVEKKFACNLCKYRTEYKQSLKKHLLIHDSNRIIRDKQFACNQCKYRTDRKESLKTHFRTHNSNRDKPFACNQCEYKTDTKQSLTRHSLTHVSNREKPFACPSCEYRTDSKSNLKLHLSTRHSKKKKKNDLLDTITSVKTSS